MKRLASLIMSAGFLLMVGCEGAEETKSDEVKESPTAVESDENEKSDKESSTEDKKSEEEPAEQPVLEEISFEEAEKYSNDIQPYLDSYIIGFNGIAEEFGKAGNDPYYMDSVEFYDNTLVALVFIQDGIEGMKTVERPSGKLGEAHDKLLEAGTHYRSGIDALAFAIDNKDIAMLEEANQQILLGNESVLEGTALLNEVLYGLTM